MAGCECGCKTKVSLDGVFFCRIEDNKKDRISAALFGKPLGRSYGLASSFQSAFATSTLFVALSQQGLASDAATASTAVASADFVQGEAEALSVLALSVQSFFASQHPDCFFLSAVFVLASFFVSQQSVFSVGFASAAGVGMSALATSATGLDALDGQQDSPATTGAAIARAAKTAESAVIVLNMVSFGI